MQFGKSTYLATATAIVGLSILASADETDSLGASKTGYRGSYYVNREIHVNTYGAPEGKPLTSGHWDFKPSWSKTGDMLVFFRRLRNDAERVIVYHAGGKLFLYRLADRETKQVSTNSGADYRYPHMERAPK